MQGGVAGGQGPQQEHWSHTEWHRGLQKHPEGPWNTANRAAVLERVGETLHFEGRVQQQGRGTPRCFGAPCAPGRCHQMNLDQFEFGRVVQRHQILVNKINLTILELGCPLFSLSFSRGISWSSIKITSAMRGL